MNPLGRNNVICPPDCPDRTATCHGACERYLAGRAKVQAEREQIKRYEREHKGMIVTPHRERQLKERSKK